VRSVIRLALKLFIQRCFVKIVAFYFRVKTCALKMEAAYPPKYWQIYTGLHAFSSYKTTFLNH